MDSRVIKMISIKVEGSGDLGDVGTGRGVGGMGKRGVGKAVAAGGLVENRFFSYFVWGFGMRSQN